MQLYSLLDKNGTDRLISRFLVLYYYKAVLKTQKHQQLQVKGISRNDRKIILNRIQALTGFK